MANLISQPRAQVPVPTSKHSAMKPLRRYFFFKGMLDRMAALALLIPGLPLIGLLVVLIRLTSKGPGIYRQVRVGCSGRYMMYKLRSMRCDAEAGTGPVWSTGGVDPRVTRLGYWLRKLHLDELPQLFNVLRGEMSLIGPRPERPEFVEVLSKSIPGYKDRLRILPGITGLAQINLPPDTDLNSVRRKLVLDLEYIETAGLLLDVRMFLCTLLRIIGIRGDRAMRLMSLSRSVRIDEVDAELDVLPGMPTSPRAIAASGNNEPSEHQPACSCTGRAHSQEGASPDSFVAVASS